MKRPNRPRRDVHRVAGKLGEVRRRSGRMPGRETHPGTAEAPVHCSAQHLARNSARKSLIGTIENRLRHQCPLEVRGYSFSPEGPLDGRV